MSSTSFVNRASASVKPLISSHIAQYHSYTSHVMWRPARKSNVSKDALERKAKRDEEKTLSAEQFARTKKPFDFPVYTKPHPSARKLSPIDLVRQIDEDNFKKIREVPRQVDRFKVGDRVAITMLNSLTEDKTQIYKGTIIERSKGRGYKGRFTLRNNSGGMFYEINMPFWTPFIRILEVLETDKSRHLRNKQGHWIRQLSPKDPRNRPL